MTQDEVDLWKARLEYADEVWRDHGLHEDSPADRKATRYLDYYRGRQDGGIEWDGIQRGDIVIDNVTFSIFNTLAANLYARSPQVNVEATRPSEKANAGRHERLVNHLIRKRSHRIKRELNRALQMAFALPFAVVRHGFTPSAEKIDRQGRLLDVYDPARPDFPWIRAVKPWDFRCDPTGETLYPEDAMWCAFRSFVPLEVLRRNPNTINRQDLSATHTWRSRGFKESVRPERSPDEAHLVEVWTVYDKERREWFQMTRGASLPIRNPDSWPIASWRTLPYNLLQFNETADDPFGVSYGELIAPLQDDLNKVLTLGVELVKRQRRLIAYDPNGLAEGEAEKLVSMSLVEFIAVANGQDASRVFRELGIGQGASQEFLFLAEYLKNEIRGMLGVGEMERGQRINVETAAEASQVGAGSAVQRSRNQAPFEDFLADVIETFALGVQDTAISEIAIPIVGPEDAAELFSATEPSGFEMVPPEGIQGDFLYSIKPGSTLPEDPQREQREVVALTAALQPFGEAVNQPQLLVDTIYAFERDPKKYVANQEMLSALTQNRAAAMSVGREAPGQAGGVLDPGLASLLAGPTQGSA